MNPNIQRLCEIAKKPTRMVIGLMSGTSLDGLDIALCSFEGCGAGTKTSLLQFETIPYPDDFKKEVRSVFAKETVSLEKLCLLNPLIALVHARFVKQSLEKWGMEAHSVDLIASHGQTIYHAPARKHRINGYGNSTLQIGDGDHLAVATGIITVSDFRQKHIAAGGEGAPLAVYGDMLLFGKKGENRVLVNIGGIANFTYLPGSTECGEVSCTDTGPGNTLMDALVQQQYPGKYFDEGAALAKKGKINEALLAALKDHVFFVQPFPKTTGPETFNLQYLDEAERKSNTHFLPVEDRMATLNKFTADSIASSIRSSMPHAAAINIFCSGGGVHNPLLMLHLKEHFPGCPFYTTEEAGIRPDAKEAVLFALLANETVCGNNKWFGKELKGIPMVSMGKISFPL